MNPAEQSGHLLMGVGPEIQSAPDAAFIESVKALPARMAARLAFMSREHHVVRDFVVRELPRQDRPLSAAQIAQVTGLGLQTVSAILSELERNLFFLVDFLGVAAGKQGNFEKTVSHLRSVVGGRDRMGGTIDILNPQKQKRVAIVASNPSVSKQTGWPIGFWWSELTHPYWEFCEHGYQVDIYSPDGGKLQADSWSDPRDESKYSADDLISLGFICSPSCWFKARLGPALPTPKSSMPMNLWASAFKLFGLRMRRRRLVERISSSRAASKHMPYATGL